MFWKRLSMISKRWSRSWNFCWRMKNLSIFLFMKKQRHVVLQIVIFTHSRIFRFSSIFMHWNWFENNLTSLSRQIISQLHFLHASTRINNLSDFRVHMWLSERHKRKECWNLKTFTRIDAFTISIMIVTNIQKMLKKWKKKRKRIQKKCVYKKFKKFRWCKKCRKCKRCKRCRKCKKFKRWMRRNRLNLMKSLLWKNFHLILCLQLMIRRR